MTVPALELGFRARKVFSVPKDDTIPNEDTFRISDRKRTYALSDGASISYDSASWSRILATHYIRDPIINSDWLAACVEEFNLRHDRENLPWNKQGAFDRGSFASLLGVQFCLKDLSLRVDAIGDTIAVLCDGQRRIESFPYVEPTQFDQSPLLLSSDPFKNPFLTTGMLNGEFSSRWSIVGLAEPMLLCATDALGQWLLSHAADDTEAISRLHRIRSLPQFARFVNEERSAKKLKRDDTTLLVLW